MICPFCRQKIAGTIKNLPRNLALIGLLGMLSKHAIGEAAAASIPTRSHNPDSMTLEELREQSRATEEEIKRREREQMKLANIERLQARRRDLIQITEGIKQEALQLSNVLKEKQLLIQANIKELAGIEEELGTLDRQSPRLEQVVAAVAVAVAQGQESPPEGSTNGSQSIPPNARRIQLPCTYEKHLYIATHAFFLTFSLWITYYLVGIMSSYPQKQEF
jgi:TolA-binding protein